MLRAAVLVGALASLGLFVAMARLVLRQLQSGGLRLPEARLTGYSVAEVDSWLAALHPAAVGSYLGRYQTLDALFMGVFALTLALGLWRAGRRRRVAFRLALLCAPVGYLVADYAENALMAEMVRGWPEPAMAKTAGLAGAFTRAKYVALGGALAIWLALTLAARRKEDG